MTRLRALLVVGVIAVMLAPPAHAQAPAAPVAKVTIRGLVDNMASFVRNYSQNDQNSTKTDRETLAHTRSRPDIIAEVGTTRYVLGFELDACWGQSGSNNDQSSGYGNLPRGSQHFGCSTGTTLNTDIANQIEVKWAYTEFDAPLPIATRVRLGAQPWDVTYKPGVLLTGDFSGANVDVTITPQVKLHTTYAFITNRYTGRNNGFLREDGLAGTVNVEVSPMKGIDIRPIYAYHMQTGLATNAYATTRVSRGGVGNNRCVGQSTLLNGTTGTPATAQAGAEPNVGQTFVGSAAPCMKDQSKEERHYIGVDARLRLGPVTVDPTFIFMNGQRQMVGSIGRLAGIEHAQKEQSWIADIRGGFQAGPALIEVIAMYTPGAKSNTDYRDSNRAVKSYSTISGDTTYFGGWTEVFAGGVDYFHSIYSPSGSRQFANAIGYDKYGLARIGTRVSYAVTPTLTPWARANVTWTAEKVNTRGNITSAANITPTEFNSQHSEGQNRYIGTEIDIGLSYRIATNVMFDIAWGHLFIGHALAAATATAVNTNGDSGTTPGAIGGKPDRHPKDVDSIATRFRFTF